MQNMEYIERRMVMGGTDFEYNYMITFYLKGEKIAELTWKFREEYTPKVILDYAYDTLIIYNKFDGKFDTVTVDKI